jgi:hypothetical protein
MSEIKLYGKIHTGIYTQNQFRRQLWEAHG